MIHFVDFSRKTRTKPNSRATAVSWRGEIFKQIKHFGIFFFKQALFVERKSLFPRSQVAVANKSAQQEEGLGKIKAVLSGARGGGR